MMELPNIDQLHIGGQKEHNQSRIDGQNQKLLSAKPKVDGEDRRIGDNPENTEGGSDATDVDGEAHLILQRMYNRAMRIREVLDLLKRFKVHMHVQLYVALCRCYAQLVHLLIFVVFPIYRSTSNRCKLLVGVGGGTDLRQDARAGGVSSNDSHSI